MTDFIHVTFPSGRVEAIPVAPVQAAGETPPREPRKKLVRNPVQKQACKHVGGAISVTTGCAGAQQGSVWECDVPEIGKCAPLAMVPFTAQGVTACRFCPKYEPAPEPGLVQLGASYLSAHARWVLAGSPPPRSQERVNELLAICSTCPFLYKGNRGNYCGKCGCPISGDAKAARNKLAMATESCPLNPPRWTADV